MRIISPKIGILRRSINPENSPLIKNSLLAVMNDLFLSVFARRFDKRGDF